MQQVRSNVFETNSSSTHSLVLSNEGLLQEVPFPKHILEKGVIDVESGEYGWEQEYYSGAWDKLSYLYTDAMMAVPHDKREETDPNTFVSEKLDLIREAIKLHTGMECNFLKSNDSYSPFGYIDHQSVGECYEVWENGIQGVINFVFNPNSYFETDNDNH